MPIPPCNPCDGTPVSLLQSQKARRASFSQLSLQQQVVLAPTAALSCVLYTVLRMISILVQDLSRQVTILARRRSIDLLAFARCSTACARSHPGQCLTGHSHANELSHTHIDRPCNLNVVTLQGTTFVSGCRSQPLQKNQYLDYLSSCRGLKPSASASGQCASGRSVPRLTRPLETLTRGDSPGAGCRRLASPLYADVSLNDAYNAVVNVVCKIGGHELKSRYIPIMAEDFKMAVKAARDHRRILLK